MKDIKLKEMDLNQVFGGTYIKIVTGTLEDNLAANKTELDRLVKERGLDDVKDEVKTAYKINVLENWGFKR